ncbi:hypothetical protein JK358_15675 [Nocardia sp. 2]|uniref:S1 motif domain-containing protein n=1 Tax=Nocardia acididurans TaxID=2802282 RepID=A0ABS1M6Q6_9NOCA|nr:hypothetical protein [Nocardia acididurans]MBL1075835.1 hypothetical protein [Nocardia acididurans]
MRWVRFQGHGVQHWLEMSDKGAILRRIEFDSAAPDPLPPQLRPERSDYPGAAVAAASITEFLSVRSRFGDSGAWVYEALRGDPAVEAEPPSDATEVTSDEFDHAWNHAVVQRNFTPCEGGPLPEGSRVTGTVEALPWGPGQTGILVDIGIPIPGFVDKAHLPGDPGEWPTIGVRGTFRVLQIRFSQWEDTARLQIRLEPIGILGRR